MHCINSLFSSLCLCFVKWLSEKRYRCTGRCFEIELRLGTFSFALCLPFSLVFSLLSFIPSLAHFTHFPRVCNTHRRHDGLPLLTMSLGISVFLSLIRTSALRGADHTHARTSVSLPPVFLLPVSSFLFHTLPYFALFCSYPSLSSLSVSLPWVVVSVCVWPCTVWCERRDGKREHFN